MKKLSKLGLAVALVLSVNFAKAETLPQRFEGCSLHPQMRTCLFRDGTAITRIKIDNEPEVFNYDYYKLVDNYERFRHTNQALILTSVSKIPPFELYSGNNPYLGQPFQLTFLDLDKNFSQNEIFVDGEKLNASNATINPKKPFEIYFNFATIPKTIILKKYIKDKLYHTFEYQLKPTQNTAFIISHNAFSSGILPTPVKYENNELSIIYEETNLQFYPLILPKDLGDIWQNSLKAKTVQERIKQITEHLYVDKNSWYAYQRDWIQVEEIEPKLTEAQSAQLSLEIDEKLKNAGLIKLDFLAPTKTENAMK